MFLTSPHRLRRVALSLRLVASVAAKSLVATCAPVRTGAHEATASNSKYFANRCSQFADVRQQCCYLLRSAPNIPSTICISTSNYPTDCNRPIPCGVMQRRTALYCEHSQTSAVRKTSFFLLKTSLIAACMRTYCKHAQHEAAGTANESAPGSLRRSLYCA